MKIFQNPYVVGGLVLVAGAFIFQNNIRPMLKRNAPAAAARPSAPAATPAAPAVQASPLPSVSSTTPAVEPSAPAGAALTQIELAKVGWDANGSPPRDPFQLSGSLTPPARLVPPVGEILTLTAIWLQTGGSLAVINGLILTEGSTIEDYRIEKIENHLVWVTGPAGRESLEFKPVASGQFEAKPVLTGGPGPRGATNTP